MFLQIFVGSMHALSFQQKAENYCSNSHQYKSLAKRPLRKLWRQSSQCFLSCIFQQRFQPWENPAQAPHWAKD